MKKRKVRVPSASASPPAPVKKPSGYVTTDYQEVKRLSAAGILALNSYGSPMVFEYAPDLTDEIQRVLGADA